MSKRAKRDNTTIFRHTTHGMEVLRWPDSGAPVVMASVLGASSSREKDRSLWAGFRITVGKKQYQLIINSRDASFLEIK